MAKKSKTHTKRRVRNFVFYRNISIASVVIGIVAFFISSAMLKAQPICANSRSCTSDLTMHIDNNAIGMFEGHRVIPPKIELTQALSNTAVLGATIPGGEKRIYVDLAAQTLYAYQGSAQIMKTLIASGKWGITPVGNYHVWEKLRSTTMAGGEGASAYDLPNVQYVMYFYHDYGLHAAYWHANFGHQMSHGCVNMRLVDARALYSWADGPSGDQLGTPVSICDRFIAPGTCIQENPIN